MEYKIKQVKLNKLLVTSLLLFIIPASFSIVNVEYEFIDKSSTILQVILFGGIVLSVFNFFFWNDEILVAKIIYDQIQINNSVFNISDVTNYKIRDDSPEFKIIRIQTKIKLFKICHRKKFTEKDDFEKFIKSFERIVRDYNIQNENQINRIPEFWETKGGKIFAYFIIITLVVFPIISIIKGIDLKFLTRYLFILCMSIPILYKVFKRQ
jgi:hypothetical protein